MVADLDANTFYEAYLLQVSAATPTVDCSYDSVDPQNIIKCMPMYTASTDIVFNLEVALSDVLEDVTIGTDGATAAEATNDVLFYVYQIDDGGGVITLDALPVMGLINVSGVAFGTDEVGKGTGYVIPYVSP